MWSTAKVASLFIVFGLSFISSLLPCITVRCLVNRFGVSKKFQWAIGVLNCFAGGVFFATSVMDLLPEARENMEAAFKDLDIDIEFPLTECIVGMGFLLILFIEHCAHVCCSRGKNLFSKPSAKNNAIQKKPQEVYSTVEYHKHNDSAGDSSPIDDVIIKPETIDSRFEGDVHTTSVDQFSKQDSDLNDNKTKCLQDGQSNQSKLNNSIERRTNNQEDQQTSAAMTFIEHQSREDHKLRVLRGIILLLALSIHMVFDGLALGLLEKQSEIWQLTLALGIHKVLVFFTIGLQLLELLKSIGKTITAGLLFSLVSPLGILIGELISSSGNAVTRVTVTAILQSMATGTFIFVTFFEILQREFSSENHQIIKVLSTVIGFALIAVIKLFTHED